MKKLAAALSAFLISAGLAWAVTAVTYQGTSGPIEATGVFVLGQHQYPVGATPVTASSGNVAAASAVATLAGVSGKTTYITGFRCGGGGATAASLVNITVAGVISGTQTYTMGPVAGATLISAPVERRWEPGIPASAANTAIVVTMPSLGAGNTNASCNAEGYQLLP